MRDCQGVWRLEYLELPSNENTDEQDDLNYTTEE